MKILELLQFNWSYALSVSIIHTIWQSLLIMGLLNLIKKMNFFQSPERKYGLHMIGMVSLFIVFMVNIALNINHEDGYALLGLAGSEYLIESLNLYIGAKYVDSISIHEIMSIVWMIGVILFLVKYFIGNIFLLNLKKVSVPVEEKYSSLMESLKKKLNIKNQIKLVQSNRLKVPLVMGIFRPLIVFPLAYFNQLTPQQFESILIHNLVHIKRNDFLINQIQVIIECLMFFNPITWYLSRQIRMYREYHCDDEVKKQIPDQKIYLTALYRIASFSGSTTPNSIALFKNKSELVMRVKRMLNQKSENYTQKPYYSLSVFSILILGLFLFNHIEDIPADEAIYSQVEELVNTEIEIPGLEIAELLQNKETVKEEITQTLYRKDMDVSRKTRKKDVIKDIPNIGGLLSSNKMHIPSEMSKYVAILDTVPNEKKIKELEIQLEAKAHEIEEISKKFEEEYSSKMELEAKKIEELAQQLEQRLSAKMEEFELQMENSVAMKEIEKLSEELEKRMTEKMQGYEAIEYNKLKPLEEKIEKLAKEMEGLIDEEGKIKDEKKMKELQKQMQSEHDVMRDLMKGFDQNHQDILNDPEIKDLNLKLQELTKEIGNMNLNREQLIDPLTKEIQHEIQTLQKELQLKMAPMQVELQKMIQEKAEELEKIARELEKERSGNH
jgi:beta-lactamase regulating signal transducer with metallopeptidase domain